MDRVCAVLVVLGWGCNGGEASCPPGTSESGGRCLADGVDAGTDEDAGSECGEESCNGQDDDCDGIVDEGVYAVTDAVQITIGAAQAESPDVVAAGDGTLVVWQQTETASALRSAHVVGTAVERHDADLLEPAAERPRLAPFGDRIALSASVLVYVGGEIAGAGPSACVFEPADAAGMLPESRCTMLTGPTDLSERGTAFGIAAAPDLVGVGFAVEGGTKIARVNEDGDEVGTEVRASDPGEDVAVAYDAENDAFAIVSARSQAVWVAFVGGSGDPIGTERTISADGATAFGPAIAWGDATGLVAWMTVEDDGFALWALEIDADGAAVGEVIALGSAVPSASDSSVDVAWNGSEWAIVHRHASAGQNADSLLLARHAPGLGAVEPAAEITSGDFVVQGGQVAWAGDGWAIAWVDDSTSAGEVHHARYGCLPE